MAKRTSATEMTVAVSPQFPDGWIDITYYIANNISSPELVILVLMLHILCYISDKRLTVTFFVGAYFVVIISYYHGRYSHKVYHIL